MRLAAKYREMQKNGTLLSNRNAIDVIDQRVTQLAERIDLNEAPDRMRKIYGLWNEFISQDNAGRITEAALTKKLISDEMEKVYHDYAAWEQLFEALDLRRKMVESEAKVLVSIKALITPEDAYRLTAKLLAAVSNVLQGEPKKIKQVQYEFARIIGESSDHVTKGFGEDVGGDGAEGGGEEGFGDVDQTQLLHPGDET